MSSPLFTIVSTFLMMESPINTQLYDKLCDDVFTVSHVVGLCQVHVVQ